MRDSQEVQELEKQIALDKQRYSEIVRLEGQLMENIPTRGFSAVPRELGYRSEQEALETSMREEEEMVAAVREHPDWHHDQRIVGENTNVNHSDIAVAAYYL